MTQSRLIRTFVASPNDVLDARNALQDVVEELNDTWGVRHGLNLQVLDWRTHVTPWLDQPPEPTLLAQLPVNSWDIFAGIMWLRLGTPTGDIDVVTGKPYRSGTEQEFILAYRCWQQRSTPKILFYRCVKEIKPVNLDIEQLRLVEEFFKQFELKGKYFGLYTEYNTIEDFKKKVRKHLTHALFDYQDGTQIVSNEDFNFVQQFIKKANLNKCILNLYSPQGFGKTTLLQMIQEEYRSTIPTVFVRVKDFLIGDKSENFRLDLFLRQIANQLETETFELDFDLEPEEYIDPSVFANKIVDLVVRRVAEKGLVFLLLIDNYDYMPVKSREIFEDLVLNCIFKQSIQMILILTSERELNFERRLDLRVRLRNHALGLLSGEDISSYIPISGMPVSEIFEWTGGGWAILVDLLINVIKRWDINHVGEYQRQQDKLLREYQDQAQIVVSLEDVFIPDEVLHVVALLRRFNATVLKTLLPKVYPGIFSSYKYKDYLDLISNLDNRVQRDHISGSYTLDKVLRDAHSRIILRFDPMTYEGIHRAAVEMYEDWFHEKNQPFDLLEMLYHQILLEKQISIINHDGVCHIVCDKLLKFIKDKSTNSSELNELENFRNALSADPDLQPFLNQEVFQSIDKILMTV